jgi:hypothetical protein
MKEQIYDIKNYTDQELFELLDLVNPTDRELEAKILHYVQKYSDMQNESGDKIAQFYIDVYTHFFDVSDDTEADQKEGLENMGDSMVEEKAPAGNEGPSVPIIKSVEYSKDKLNPLLKETTFRTINISSSFRVDKKTPSTNFIFNLSEPLRDVVSLKLYSVIIPYSWYTVNNSFGGNFFMIEGNVPGINNGNHNYKVSIRSGNYTPSNLVSAINDSIQELKTTITDVNFGESGITYDDNRILATMKMDITKVFNTTNYYLEFPGSTTNPDELERSKLLSVYLGYNYNTYNCCEINSARDLPLIDNAVDNPDNVSSVYLVNQYNRGFKIVQYTGDSYDTNTVIHETIDISLNLLGSRTRNAIVSDLTNVLASHTKIDPAHTSIQRIDITNPLLANNAKSYFKLSLKLNRYTTKNVPYAKIAVVFPEEFEQAGHYPIWTGGNSCFHFEYIENETNMIIAESEMSQSNYIIDATYQIQLNCLTFPFNTTYNQYIADIEDSNVNGYLLSEYITAMNVALQNANTTYSISDDSDDLNIPNTAIAIDENNLLDFTVDLNRIFRNRYYSLNSSFRYVGNYVTDLSNANVSTFVNFFDITGAYSLGINDVFQLIPKSTYGFVNNINAGKLILGVETLLGDIPENTNLVEVQEHPKYAKYFGMLNVGFASDYVKNKMENENMDPDLLDTPTELIPMCETSVTYTKYTDLQNAINGLFINYKDYWGDRPLQNTRIRFEVVGGRSIKSTLSLVINKTLTQLNYGITLYDSKKSLPTIPSRWVSGLYFNETYILADQPLINGVSVITNNQPISDNEILLENGINNYFYLKPYSDIDGLYTNDGVYDVKVEIEPRRYSRNTLFTAINNAFAETELAYLSSIQTYVESGVEYTVMHINVSKIYTTRDHRLVFYDPYSFISCSTGGTNNSVKNATWDSTIGWLLGFRESTTYYFEDYINSPTTLIGYDTTNTNMCVMTGDTCVNVNLFNYFLIMLDDFTQNHLNDGLVTITYPETMINESSGLNYVCDPITNKKVLSSIGDVGATKQLTSAQLYANNQKILSKKVKEMSFLSRPFLKDVFAFVPIKPGSNGSYSVSDGGTLQNQERVYFGPVNIHRMSVKLLNDRGDLVDLNNADWSITLTCTQLYNSSLKYNTKK